MKAVPSRWIACIKSFEETPETRPDKLMDFMKDFWLMYMSLCLFLHDERVSHVPAPFSVYVQKNIFFQQRLTMPAKIGNMLDSTFSKEDYHLYTRQVPYGRGNSLPRVLQTPLRPLFFILHW